MSHTPHSAVAILLLLVTGYSHGLHCYMCYYGEIAGYTEPLIKVYANFGFNATSDCEDSYVPTEKAASYECLDGYDVCVKFKASIDDKTFVGRGCYNDCPTAEVESVKGFGVSCCSTDNCNSSVTTGIASMLISLPLWTLFF